MPRMQVLPLNGRVALLVQLPVCGECLTRLVTTINQRCAGDLCRCCRLVVAFVSLEKDLSWLLGNA
jgi:hypothetical protein